MRIALAIAAAAALVPDRATAAHDASASPVQEITGEWRDKFPASATASEDTTSEWEPTPESERFDVYASICLDLATKAGAERSIRKERAYSKRYGVLDLEEINNFKHQIQYADEDIMAQQAKLKTLGKGKATPCTDRFMKDFIGCVEDQADSEFVNMPQEDRFKDCHARNF